MPRASSWCGRERTPSTGSSRRATSSRARRRRRRRSARSGRRRGWRRRRWRRSAPWSTRTRARTVRVEYLPAAPPARGGGGRVARVALVPARRRPRPPHVLLEPGPPARGARARQPPARASRAKTGDRAMRSDQLLTTVDFHTAGIGMRLVTSGVGRLPGATIAEKRRAFQGADGLDVRTGLCLEPRGHRCPPHRGDDEAARGATSASSSCRGGYYVSCGEGTDGAGPWRSRPASFARAPRRGA